MSARSTLPSTTHSPFLSPARIPNLQLNPGSHKLKYVGAVKTGSLIAGYSWCLYDPFDHIICQGSASLHQSYPSLVRAEYEAIWRGLQAAYKLNIPTLKIQGCSELATAQLSGRSMIPHLNTVYKLVDDIVPSIEHLLNQFEKPIQMELIDAESNFYLHMMAEKAIDDNDKEKEVISINDALTTLKSNSWSHYPTTMTSRSSYASTVTLSPINSVGPSEDSLSSEPMYYPFGNCNDPVDKLTPLPGPAHSPKSLQLPTPSVENTDTNTQSISVSDLSLWFGCREALSPKARQQLFNPVLF